MVSAAPQFFSYLVHDEMVDQATILLLSLKPVFVLMPAGFEPVAWPSPSCDLLLLTKSTPTRCSMVLANQAVVFIHIALDVFVELLEPAAPICLAPPSLLCVFTAIHHRN
jgi:hypothetical protein